MLAYVERARARGAFTIAITNDPDSALGEAAEAVLPLAAGPERSIAATKTYTAQVAALALLAGHAARAGAGDRRRHSRRRPRSWTTRCRHSSGGWRRSRSHSPSSAGCS